MAKRNELQMLVQESHSLGPEARSQTDVGMRMGFLLVHQQFVIVCELASASLLKPVPEPLGEEVVSIWLSIESQETTSQHLFSLSSPWSGSRIESQRIDSWSMEKKEDVNRC